MRFSKKKTGIVIGILAGIGVVGAYFLYKKHLKGLFADSEQDDEDDYDDYDDFEENEDDDVPDDYEPEEEEEDKKDFHGQTFAKDVYSLLRFDMPDFEQAFLDVDKTLRATGTDDGIVRVKETESRVAITIGIDYKIISNSVGHSKKNMLSIYNLRDYFGDLVDRCRKYVPEWACGRVYGRFKGYYTESWINKPKIVENPDGTKEDEWEDLDPETGIPERHYRIVEFSPTVVDPRTDKHKVIPWLDHIYIDPETGKKGYIDLKNLSNLLAYYVYFSEELRKGPVKIADDYSRTDIRIEESHFGFEMNFKKKDDGQGFTQGVTPTMIANVLKEIFLSSDEDVKTSAGITKTVIPPNHLLIYEDSYESEVVGETRLKDGKVVLVNTEIQLGE